jgi:hypothetical protein
MISSSAGASQGKTENGVRNETWRQPGFAAPQRGFAANGQRSAVSFQLSTVGVWPVALRFTPGGARKIGAACKGF